MNATNGGNEAAAEPALGTGEAHDASADDGAHDPHPRWPTELLASKLESIARAEGTRPEEATVAIDDEGPRRVNLLTLNRKVFDFILTHNSQALGSSFLSIVRSALEALDRIVAERSDLLGQPWRAAPAFSIDGLEHVMTISFSPTGPRLTIDDLQSRATLKLAPVTADEIRMPDARERVNDELVTNGLRSIEPLFNEFADAVHRGAFSYDPELELQLTHDLSALRHEMWETARLRPRLVAEYTAIAIRALAGLAEHKTEHDELYAILALHDERPLTPERLIEIRDNLAARIESPELESGADQKVFVDASLGWRRNADVGAWGMAVGIFQLTAMICAVGLSPFSSVCVGAMAGAVSMCAILESRSR